MKNSGYIKLHRSIVENDIYHLPPLYNRIFTRLLLEVNHSDVTIPYRRNGKVESKLIQRGERLTSMRQIAEWVSWYERGKMKKPNPKIVKEVMDYLVMQKMIFIYDKGNRQETHYKVLNYNIFQGSDVDKSNSSETPKKQTPPSNKNDNNDNIPYKDIVEYLNEVSGKKYSFKSDQNRKLIKARWNEGFRLEDFKKVIDKKVQHWKDDPAMKQYIRPATLFNGKFDNYLNQDMSAPVPPKQPQSNTYLDIQNQNVENFYKNLGR